MRLFKKSIISIILMVFSLAMACIVQADTNEVLLVLDMRNAPQLPKNFRTSDLIATSNKKINTTGWKNLRMAGGSQFSEMSLIKVIERLKLKHFTVIDLRQESHGFLNGNAVSWYGPQDAANAGLSQQEIEDRETSLLNRLSQEKNAVVNQILKKSSSGRIAQTKPVEFAVHRVSSEREIVQKHHLRYHRLYIQDFHEPTDKEVDRFIHIVKELPAEEWVYFHCRAGVGRTTTLMTMLDMMRNAKTVSFEDILTRQRAIGGKDLAKLPLRQSFKYQAAANRLQFLKAFYEYAKNNKDNFETSWTEYQAAHS